MLSSVRFIVLHHHHHHPCLLCPVLHGLVSAERRALQPSDCVYSESLTPQGKLVTCHRDLTEILVCKHPLLFLPHFLFSIGSVSDFQKRWWKQKVQAAHLKWSREFYILICVCHFHWKLIFCFWMCLPIKLKNVHTKSKIIFSLPYLDRASFL